MGAAPGVGEEAFATGAASGRFLNRRKRAEAI